MIGILPFSDFDYFAIKSKIINNKITVENLRNVTMSCDNLENLIKKQFEELFTQQNIYHKQSKTCDNYLETIINKQFEDFFTQQSSYHKQSELAINKVISFIEMIADKNLITSTKNLLEENTRNLTAKISESTHLIDKNFEENESTLRVLFNTVIQSSSKVLQENFESLMKRLITDNESTSVMIYFMGGIICLILLLVVGFMTDEYKRRRQIFARQTRQIERSHHIQMNSLANEEEKIENLL
jgi:hypothetical protein